MKRRQFLRTSLFAAGAMCLDMKAFAERIKSSGEPLLRIGILSDIHIRNAANADVFLHALEYYRGRGVDGVLIAGDMADHGLESQLQVVADTWFKVFPKDKGLDGKHVERLFVYGNHDVEGHNYGGCELNAEGKKLDAEGKKREAIGLRREEVWKKVFKEDYTPIYIKEVKGYKFVGAHWDTWKGIAAVSEFMEQHASEFDPSKPFFYFQHPHPKNTCSGPWVWGQDDGKTTAALSAFPNVVAFSGHSHTPLTDDRTIWQGAFTSVGTSSLSYICPFGARENSHVDGSSEKVPAQMPSMSTGDGKQGMYMTIYADCITLERMEFVNDQSLGDNWVIPLPNPGEKPLSYEYRAKIAQVPQFALTDKVTITRQNGKDRYGVEQGQIVVHFPSVLKKRTGVRAYDYEVQAEIHEVDVYRIHATKRVFSGKYYMGEAQDEAEVILPFGEGELPPNREVRFIVRPCECFGKKGEPIYSDWIPTRKEK